ncbi:uncharacterized protein LOC143465260 isoform X2 [Clavelina lepadiformis]|uniref:uncharacterized protein LOC143465260 isoform X2 n=1 Tax=Clavelina lepadiformis TaxID=159417 RepID=UPI0040411A79
MKAKLILCLLCGLSVLETTYSLHEDEIQAQYITMEDYLDQVTESVDKELTSNSFLAHQYPFRWSEALKPFEYKVEKGLAILLEEHYNYLLKLRRQLKKLNNMYPDRIDMWPIHRALLQDGGNMSDSIHHLNSFAWEQPEWMEGIFEEMEGLRMELEDLLGA